MKIDTVEYNEVRPGEMTGTAVQRREDRHLLTGDARYTDDIQYPGMGYLALLGSQYAHARIESIDVSDAEARSDVIAVYTYHDLLESGLDGAMPAAELDAEDLQEDGTNEEDTSVKRPLLADDRVRYQGQPVAAVVAEERYAAFDALDAIDVEYERLDAAPELDDAVSSDAPTIHDPAPNNVAFEWETGEREETEEAFSGAAHTVSLDPSNNRVIPTAIEPRAAVAQYQPSDDKLTVELSSQNPHAVQNRLGDVLGLPRHRITVRVPDVGGGFGAKLQPYAGHLLTAWCSMQLERPIKWQARRTDDFQSMVHARRQRTTIEAALDESGHIVALRGDIDADLGGYPTVGGVGIPKGTAGMLCGAYDIDVGHVTVRGVMTNTAPISAYRGAGRPEAAYIIERLASACARELDMDPVEFRRRNFIPPEAFPVETGLGMNYDSGEYEKTLDRALELVEYDAFLERQERARDDGRYLGIGISSYVEICGGSAGSIESGQVRVNADGQVVVHTGTQDTGQGHATSYAQIVSDELGVDYDTIEIVEGDTDKVTEGGGTAGSRSLPMAGNAIRKASRGIEEKARTIAAHQLEASEADIEFSDGEFHVRGAPEYGVTFQDVANAAYNPRKLPDDVDPGLETSVYFEPEGSTAPFGTHVAIVEVDPETGEISFQRYLAVDDVGPQVNPKLVEGQIVGGIVQGIGQALYEDGHYDSNGNLATSSLQDYAIPKTISVPDIEWDSTVTPSPNNALGVKGVGEAGTIGSMPAVVNAVLDALEPFGVETLDMPLTNETVWSAIETANGG
ncbi:xanthine dehydrogenase family protein molybdopterin-binding subunit [Haladaptatus sp. AB643]|uniref:xanthine dehydrogenase family protein molybdopterin-binding subunit n=1 Tax=Haladaptatus sp. AB643 TaxID=2934174 RepID=UPI00209C60D7|nr:xanthine dehydrogenase family protein molybdopterin-binding subunit [Haladaptatus sp. AB643]MCO8243634.1 xanthine dehydrogenase family protein molybdopterin-binding subunit [Haladaptatus sp. AB643]